MAADGSHVFCWGCVEPGHYHNTAEKLKDALDSEPSNEFNGQIVTNTDANSPFLAEAGRYELIVSAGCPFASRAWATAVCLGLDVDTIRVVRCWPANSETGFFFSPTTDEERSFVEKNISGVEWEQQGPSSGVPVTHVRDLYLQTNPRFDGAFSVPILYDTKTKAIVSNSSIDIAVQLATQFRTFCKYPDLSLIPDNDIAAVKAAMLDVHARINLAPYKAHFATVQADYENKAVQFFEDLQSFEDKLTFDPKTGLQKYVMGGDQPSLADFCLAATLLRLPLVYFSKFRMSLKTFNEANYPNLVRYLRNMCAALPEYVKTIDLRGIITQYALSTPLNAKAGKTVPLVPLDFIL